jgi:hypothetical protein
VSVGAFLVLAAAGGVGWWWLHSRTDHTTTAISLDQAVEDYRGTASVAPTTAPPQTTPPTTARPAQPAPGVYSYTSAGGDAVDALGGASHTYPATTTITVTAAPGGCTTQRWTAAEERWDETTTCPVGAGLQMQRFVAFHRFFGSDDTEAYACDGDARPLAAPAGTAWTARCVSGDDTSIYHGSVVGTETMTVAGSAVTAEHVAVTIEDGDSRDTQRTESWYLAGTDLVVRRVSDIATTESSPIGDVHYTEHYEISLASLRPLG